MYKTPPFHKYADHNARLATAVQPISRVDKHVTVLERAMEYDFELHQHPFVSQLVTRLMSGSIAGLQDADTSTPAEVFFDAYRPTKLVEPQPPQREIDFAHFGAYAVYNWELFFHIPLTIAIQLSKNGRYEEARQWFHYVFDPTDTSVEPAPQRYWKLQPFKKSDVEHIQDTLLNLSSKADPALRDRAVKCIEAWKEAPFRPHLIARYRPTAYMLKTVMAYLDNLIAWGDSLFRQDTREAINDALQLYVLAASLLGPRPQRSPDRGHLKTETYRSLRKDLDEFSNVLRSFEADIPFEAVPIPTPAAGDDRLTGSASLARTLYFCVPPNERIVRYWDTVGDRLYKIRNSLNLQGVFRQLPLFPPAIEPGVLAAAAAAGLEVAAVVAGAQQPLPLVRYAVLAQKAVDLCQEVRSLGAQLLAAIEKVDGEKLTLLRAHHERQMLDLAEMVRYGQWQDSIKAREALERGFDTAVQRHTYYQRLLGKDLNEIQVPRLAPIDRKGLEDGSLAATEPPHPTQDVPVDIAGETGGFKVSSHEKAEGVKLEIAQALEDASAAISAIGAFLNIIPDVSADAKPIGVGGGVKFGGKNLGLLFSGIASITKGAAARVSFEARRSSRIAGFARREQEWAFQSNLAVCELNQIYKQLRAAQIREAVAEREYRNHQQQIANAKEIEEFLTGESGVRTVTESFYAWMKAEARSLYTRAFDLAFEVASKAERALRKELGDSSLRFLAPSYMGGNEGLLAGEKLYADLKRMEVAWLDRNARELELTKHVSLNALDPEALLELRATGRCMVALPESLFDLDAPGHYFRRIRSVAVSIPCVTGPYLSVCCKLTLQKSAIRISPSLLGGKYERQPEGDTDRFDDNFGTLQSIVTSTGVNDAGMFETNLREERLLPFEGHGAVSEWSVELPSDVRAFDYDTISDVVLHLRYTARDAGETLAMAASKSLQKAIEDAAALGSTRLFSVRHEFPSEWARFKAAPAPTASARAELSLHLDESHYPFWRRQLKKVKVHQVKLYAYSDNGGAKVWSVKSGGTSDSLVKWRESLFRTDLENAKAAVASDVGDAKLYFDDNTMSDLFIAVTWGK